MKLQNICVFCGSSVGARSEYAEAARQLGKLLAAVGIGLVFGGGKVGLMGVLADAVLVNGGRATGVIPYALVAREVAHDGLSDLRVVHTMHERKALMADLSQAFIALPGGLGTFEEFCEALTWSQLGIHAKPCGLLNVNGYYDPLLRLFDRAVQEGFVQPENRRLVLDEREPEALLQSIKNFQPRPAEAWIDSTTR
jgi:uncharacterized protein (TIGR00730 family)